MFVVSSQRAKRGRAVGMSQVRLTIKKLKADILIILWRVEAFLYEIVGLSHVHMDKVTQQMARKVIYDPHK